MTSDFRYRSSEDLDSHRGPRGQSGVPGKVAVSSRLPAQPIILRKHDGNGVAPDADVAIDRASASSGQALPEDLRSRFEASLGADLSSVRIHNGAESAQAASAVGARAYATGNDIHFAAGTYDPSSAFGVHLIAHEVAHTVQQQGAAPTTQHKLEVSGPADTAEIEADVAAEAMIEGAPAAVTTHAGVIQRVADPAAPAAEGAPAAGGGDAEESKSPADELASFQPELTMQPATIELDMFDDTTITAALMNVDALPDGTSWSIAWNSDGDSAVAKATGAAGPGGVCTIPIAAGTKPGATTMTFKFTGAIDGNTIEKAAGSLAVTVRQPVLEDASPAGGGICAPKDEMEIVLRIKNVKDPQTNVQLESAIECGASASQLSAEAGGAFPDAFQIKSAVVEGDQIKCTVVAHHAGTGELKLSAKIGTKTLDHTASFECASSLDEFKARLESAQNIVQPIISGAINVVNGLDSAITAALAKHKSVIAAEVAANAKSQKLFKEIAKWGLDMVELGLGTRGKAASKTAKYVLAVADLGGTQAVASGLQGLSSALPGFAGTITAANGAGGADAFKTGIAMANAIGATCSCTIEAWRSWANSPPDPAVQVTVDPADLLLQSLQPRGLMPVPDVPSADDIEAAIWSHWLTTSGMGVSCNADGSSDPSLDPDALRVDASGPINQRLQKFGLALPEWKAP